MLLFGWLLIGFEKGSIRMKNIRELNFQDLSDIQVDLFKGTSEISRRDMIVIKFKGVYRLGSGGNGDAQYMYAMGKAALAAWYCAGVILDWSELDYQWGDLLEKVLDIGAHQYVDAPFPTAVVVGPQCEEAVRTLLGLDSKGTIEDIGFVFRDLTSACHYIDRLIMKK
jgi:hypothetical protein